MTFLSLLRPRLAAVSLALAAAVVACGDDVTPEEPVIIRTDNGIPRCGKPVVYLNFDGVTVFKGDVDDSRTNVAQVPEFPDEGMVFPPYPNQADAIKIRDQIYAQLARLRIPAVHERPRSGDYFMMVFGNKFLLGVQSGRTSPNCGYSNRNSIGFINTAFYSIHGGLEFVTHGALLVLGRALGIDPVSGAVVNSNCMANDVFLRQCTFFAVESTLGPCTTGPQDQLALLRQLACE